MNDTLSRRVFLKLAAVTTAGAWLAACQAPAPAAPGAVQEEGEGASAPAQDKKVVTFTMYGHPGMIEEMVPIFNADHPDVEVQFERSEGQGYWEKLSAAIAAGTAWDCFRSDQARALNWGPKGAIANVADLIAQDTEYPKEGYIPGIVDAYNVGGNIYGVPTWCLTMWMYYNKKMFDEAGVPYPTPTTTWDEYVAAAEKLTKRDGDRITQFGANGWQSWTFPVAQIAWSNGGPFYYNADMTKVAVDDPKTVEALQKLADLIHVQKVNPNPTVPASSPVGILSENVATEGNGDYLPWDNKDVFEQKLEYIDATLCPSFDGKRSNIYWPDCMSINSKSQVPDAAYQWISWFGRDPKATAIQCRVVFPVYTDAYTNEEIRNTWLVAPRPPGMIAAAAEHVANAKIWLVDTHINDIDTIYYNEIGALWGGTADAETVATKITQAANEAMAKPA
jgi:multiple sugar transport system substrate-binding protein